MDYYINKINKDFPYMKFEVELNGHPKIDICENCDNGEIADDYGDYDRCEYCEGTCYSMEDIENEFRNNLKNKNISLDIFSYIQVYNDGSVDYELTFTIPTDQTKKVPEIVKCFTAIFPDYNSRNAGYHIAVLKNSYYPITNPDYALDTNKLMNFQKENTKLIPAYILLGSNHNKTRSFSFREPKISHEKYSFIHILEGGLEYRCFDACLDNPEKTMDYIKVIAKTLLFYSNKKANTIYKEFEINTSDFPTGRRQKVYKVYKSQKNYDALKDCLKAIKVKEKIMFKPSKKKKHNFYNDYMAVKNWQLAIEHREKYNNDCVKAHFLKTIKAKKAMEVLDKGLDNITANEYLKAKEHEQAILSPLQQSLKKDNFEILKDIRKYFSNTNGSEGITYQTYKNINQTIKLKGVV